jgi:hypothetical protein
LEVDSPYEHNKLADESERAGKLRDAERELKLAIKAADALPISEYLGNFVDELNKYRKDPNYQTSPGVSLDQLKQAYRRLILVPFMTRFQLASFYARHGGIPESKEIIEQAFEMPMDDLVRKDPEVSQILERAEEFKKALHDVMGPDHLSELFTNLFDKLDQDKNGFVHESELRRAQFDISIGPEGQNMIRHLLYHYLDVEAASHDEWGVDILGISKKDVAAFEKKTGENWRRLKDSHNE